MEDRLKKKKRQMRENESVYKEHGNFDEVGGFQKYSDEVAKCGTFVEGNVEIAATADYIGRHILIFGADKEHDVLIRAGHLGAPTAAVVNKKPIMIVHYQKAEHYTGTRPIEHSWNASTGSKKAIRNRKEDRERLHDMKSAIELLIQEHESKLDDEQNIGEDESMELALALSQAENEGRLKSVQDEKVHTEHALALSQAENEARLKAAQKEKKKDGPRISTSSGSE